MTEEAKKKNNKNLVIGICVGVLIITIIIVAVFFGTKGAITLNDAYFVSDDTKYVIAVDDDAIESDEKTAFKPDKTYIVYNYSGDAITSMVTYMEFADNATAKQALAYYQKAYADTDLNESGIANMYANGKYLAISATSDQYANMSASEIKQYIEFKEMMQNVDSNDQENVEDTKDYETDAIEIDDEDAE
jgi:hypothetical protein